MCPQHGGGFSRKHPTEARSRAEHVREGFTSTSSCQAPAYPSSRQPWVPFYRAHGGGSTEPGPSLLLLTPESGFLTANSVV